MQPERGWEPVLDGDLAARAEEAIRTVAGHLKATAGTVAAESAPGETPAADPSLAAGTAGLAILFSYLHQAWPGEGHDDTALRFLEEAIGGVGAHRLGPDLYSGFTGVAWVVTHLDGRLLDLGSGDAVGGIDATLLEYLARTPGTGEYDLISGLVGHGVYGLERLECESRLAPAKSEPDNSAFRIPHSAIVERVIERLAETAERGADGITWFTPPALLPEWQREQCPNGYYNLGLAHGVPGVIALLGAACAAGIQEDTARPLLDGAIRWLTRQELSEGQLTRFSSWAGPGVERDPSRLGWCYGDLGLAAAMLVAGRCVRNAEWEANARRIGLAASARTAADGYVQDTGLCHGAAGNAHLFNRMYQTTGDSRFGDAARRWFEQALAMRHPDRGIGGFPAYTVSGAGHEPGWLDEPGFLMGAGGVALALLGGITSVAPDWDRILLVSAPALPA